MSQGWLMPDNPDKHRIDRTAFSIINLGDDSEDIEYWHSRTPEERWEYAEYLRQLNYADAPKRRLQDFFEVVDFPSD